MRPDSLVLGCLAAFLLPTRTELDLARDRAMAAAGRHHRRLADVRC